MLYRTDLYLVIKYYWLLSKFGGIPVNVILQPVRFKAKSSIKGVLLIRGPLWCRLCLLWYSLIYTILYPSGKFYHFLASLCFSLGGTAAFVMDQLLVNNRTFIASACNDFYRHLLAGNRPWKYFWKVAGAEVVLIFTPVIVFNFSLPSLILIFWFDPETPLLLWAHVPRGYRNIYNFFFFVCLDFVGITLLMTLVMFIVVCGIGFVATMDKRLTMAHREISRVHKTGLTPLAAIRVMDAAAAELREIQTWLKLFNQFASLIVYLSKQISLSISIVCLFISIFYIERDPAISIIGFIFGIPMLMFYNVVFDKAFGLPNKMERIKVNFRIAAHSLKLSYRKTYYSRLANSFQFKGIQVGSFGVLERESTPNFMNFFAQELGSLLVGTDQL